MALGEHIECTSFGNVSYHLDFITSQMKPQRRNVGNVPNFRLFISLSLFSINIVSTRCHLSSSGKGIYTFCTFSNLWAFYFFAHRGSRRTSNAFPWFNYMGQVQVCLCICINMLSVYTIQGCVEERSYGAIFGHVNRHFCTKINRQEQLNTFNNLW